MNNQLLSGVCCFGFVLFGASSAHAQEAAARSGASSDYEIVVTAQKRSESLQDVPLSIAAFAGDRLERSGNPTLEGLSALVPSLQFSTSEGKGQPAIRGIGNQFLLGAAESAVATHIDGFYIPRLSGIVGSFLDLERIEVLKGPQGTLYGRNATAGTINIITKKPSRETEVLASLEGSYIDRGDGTGGGFGVRASAVLNLPVNDNIRTRLSVMKVNRDGYFKAYYPAGKTVDIGDADEIYVRGQVDIDLNDKLNWLLATDNYWADDRGAFVYHTIGSRPDVLMIGAQLGFQTGGKSRRVFLDRPVKNKPRTNAFTSTLSWTASDALTIKSLTQYRYTGYNMSGEFDLSQANLSELDYRIKSKAVSQEFQAIFDAGRFKGIVGAYYFHEKATIDQYFGLLLFGPHDLAISGGTKTKAYAGFADLTYSLTDTLDVTVGARYSSETKGGYQAAVYRIGGVPVIVNDAMLDDRTFHAFTPKLVINYRPTDDLTLYVSGQKGFKSGGFSIGSLNQNTPFGPEKIKAVEAGVKARMFDRKLGLNAAAFYYDYTDLQLEDVIELVTVTRNAGTARVYGFEWDGYVLPADGLRIDFSGAVLDAKMKSGELVNPLFPEHPDPVSLRGKQLPKASKFSGSATVTYDHDLPSGARISPSFTASYRSHQYFTVFNNDRVEQNGYWWLRASLTYRAPNDRWSLTAFGDNLANKYVLTTGVPSTPAYGYPLQSGVAPPRTIGLRFETRM